MILLYSSVKNSDSEKATIIFDSQSTTAADSQSKDDNAGDAVDDTDKADTDITTTVYTPSYPVDINKAIYEDFIGVKGIGEVTAQKILDFRSEKGVIHSLDELTEISGIGQKTVLLLGEYFYVDALQTTVITTTTLPKTKPVTAVTTTKAPVKVTTTIPVTTTQKPQTTTVITTTELPQRKSVNINTASVVELTECLLIEQADAEAIVEFREKIGYFTNIRELIYVISDHLYLEIRDYIYVE